MLALSIAFGYTPSFCRSGSCYVSLDRADLIRTLLEATGRLVFKHAGTLSNLNCAKHDNKALKASAASACIATLISRVVDLQSDFWRQEAEGQQEVGAIPAAILPSADSSCARLSFPRFCWTTKSLTARSGPWRFGTSACFAIPINTLLSRYFNNLNPAMEDSGANDLASDVVRARCFLHCFARTLAARLFARLLRRRFSHRTSSTSTEVFENVVSTPCLIRERPGMFAQDPSSSALMLAMSPKRGLCKRPEEITLVSIGTGKVQRYIEDSSHDWGYVQWLPKLVNVFWDGMMLKSEHECRRAISWAFSVYVVL